MGHTLKTNDIVTDDNGDTYIVRAIRAIKSGIIIDMSPVDYMNIKTVDLDEIKLYDKSDRKYRAKFADPIRSDRRNKGVNIEDENIGFSLKIPDGIPKHKIKTILKQLLDEIEE